MSSKNRTMPKLGSEIDRVLKRYNDQGKCVTCGNRIEISDDYFGCMAKDKIYWHFETPYHGKDVSTCSDWIDGNGIECSLNLEASPDMVSDIMEGLCQDTK